MQDNIQAEYPDLCKTISKLSILTYDNIQAEYTEFKLPLPSKLYPVKGACDAGRGWWHSLNMHMKNMGALYMHMRNSNI